RLLHYMDYIEMLHSKGFVALVMLTFVTKFLYLKSEIGGKSIGSGDTASNQRLYKYKPSLNELSEYKVSNQDLSSHQGDKLERFKEKSSCRSMFEIHKPTGHNWDKDTPYETLSKDLPPLLIWPQEGGTGTSSGSSSNSGQSKER
ncbi:unnamed protein product, partial [Meganyctiphanes norvegica]